MGNLASGKSALVHRYLTGTYVQEESPEGRLRGGQAPRPVLKLSSPSDESRAETALELGAEEILGRVVFSAALGPPSEGRRGPGAGHSRDVLWVPVPLSLAVLSFQTLTQSFPFKYCSAVSPMERPSLYASRATSCDLVTGTSRQVTAPCV